MSPIDTDRRRLDEFHRLYCDISDTRMPPAMQREIDNLSDQLIGAAHAVNRVLDAFSAAGAFLLEVYAYIKTLPAADDG